MPNKVLALMQMIPGVYAGPEELAQWCQLRGRKIIVIDQDGSVMKYDAGGGHLILTYDPALAIVLLRVRIRGMALDARIQVLYK